MRTAAVFLLACAPAFAAESPARTESVGELFRASVPEDWTSTGRTGPDREVRYSDGTLSITAARRGLPGSAVPSEKEFLAQFKKGTEDFKELKGRKISGRPAKRWSRRFRVNYGGDEMASDPTEWVYEEAVLVPNGKAFWILTFRSPALEYEPEPAGLPVWNAFLKSFRLD